MLRNRANEKVSIQNSLIRVQYSIQTRDLQEETLTHSPTYRFLYLSLDLYSTRQARVPVLPWSINTQRHGVVHRHSEWKRKQNNLIYLGK